MKTFKIIAKTNGYIASRDIVFNGKTEVELESNLTYEDAIKKLESFFYDDYGHNPSEFELSYDEETGISTYGKDERWTDFSDGTAMYEYDSRYYSIEEELTN